jgi:predicted O-methyltransferase YrrM
VIAAHEPHRLQLRMLRMMIRNRCLLHRGSAGVGTEKAPSSLMANIINRLVKRLPPIHRLILQRDELLAAMRQLHRMCSPPGHFSSPIPSLAEIQAYAAKFQHGCDQPPAGIELCAAEQLELFERLRLLCEELPFTADSSPAHRYYYNNPWFCRHDAMVLCAMLRHLRPCRVIEVGSGFSSAAMLDINDLFLDQSTRFTFIEPNPERLDSLLASRDRRSAAIYRQRVQEIDLTIFEELESGDILFIDSSHISRMGSDLNHLVFNVLPRLKVGVHIHFHDIYYPFEYPPQLLLDGQYWNEAYLLRAFLQYNKAFRIELFSSWIRRRI